MQEAQAQQMQLQNDNINSQTTKNLSNANRDNKTTLREMMS